MQETYIVQRTYTKCIYNFYCQEDDCKPTEIGEGDSTEKTVKESDQNVSSEKTSTPNKDAKEKESRKRILDTIKLPLVSVFPRKKNKVVNS